MFNNVAFNVVIGLVFIYLLYSLLATIMGEMLSSWMGLRQRILRTAIERMLNDGYAKRVNNTTYNKLESWWARFVLKTPPGFSNTFAGRFYGEPSIKYLSRIEEDEKWLFSNSKPSYISAENFANTVITMLFDKGAGATKLERIRYCLDNNTLDIEPETTKQLKNLLIDSSGDLNLFQAKLMAWYNETMDRTTGWYKRKLKTVIFYFSFIVAIGFNVDTIRIAKLLARDDEARNQLVTMGVALVKDSSRYKDYIISGQDTIRPQNVIDSGFNRITKDISTASLVLGLGWNFDSLRKVTTCTAQNISGPLKDFFDSAYNSEEKNIAQYNRQLLANGLIRDRNERYLVEQEIIISRLKEIQAIDSKNAAVLKTLETAIDSSRQLKVSILKTSFLQKDDSISLHHSQAKMKKLLSDINRAAGAHFISIQRVNSDKKTGQLVITGTRQLGPGEAFCRFCSIFFLEWGWLGCVLTALALSLGAPFWFGVLSKLVQLRESGPKPEDKESELKKSAAIRTTSDEKDITLPAESDAEAAIRLYAGKIENEPGVLIVAAGYKVVNGQVKDCLQVHVDNETNAIAIRRKYGDIKMPGNEVLLIEVLATGPAVKNSEDPVNPDLGIQNAKKIFKPGSFGCIVNINGLPDELRLLTCYHVLNGDDNWKGQPVNQEITNVKNRRISSSYTAILDNHHDTALAVVDRITAARYQQLKDIPSKGRSISRDDVFVTKVFLKGYMTNEEGLIVHNSWTDTLSYHTADETIQNKFEDLLLITKISKVGDSGAVLVDENGDAVGMVIGSNSLHTIAIKITRILNDFNIQISKKLK